MKKTLVYLIIALMTIAANAYTYTTMPTYDQYICHYYGWCFYSTSSTPSSETEAINCEMHEQISQYLEMARSSSTPTCTSTYSWATIEVGGRNYSTGFAAKFAAYTLQSASKLGRIHVARLANGSLAVASSTAASHACGESTPTTYYVFPNVTCQTGQPCNFKLYVGGSVITNVMNGTLDDPTTYCYTPYLTRKITRTTNASKVELTPHYLPETVTWRCNITARSGDFGTEGGAEVRKQTSSTSYNLSADVSFTIPAELTNTLVHSAVASCELSAPVKGTKTIHVYADGYSPSNPGTQVDRWVWVRENDEFVLRDWTLLHDFNAVPYLGAHDVAYTGREFSLGFRLISKGTANDAAFYAYNLSFASIPPGCNINASYVNPNVLPNAIGYPYYDLSEDSVVLYCQQPGILKANLKLYRTTYPTPDTIPAVDENFDINVKEAELIVNNVQQVKGEEDNYTRLLFTVEGKYDLLGDVSDVFCNINYTNVFNIMYTVENLSVKPLHRFGSPVLWYVNYETSTTAELKNYSIYCFGGYDGSGGGSSNQSKYMNLTLDFTHGSGLSGTLSGYSVVRLQLNTTAEDFNRVYNCSNFHIYDEENNEVRYEYDHGCGTENTTYWVLVDDLKNDTSLKLVFSGEPGNFSDSTIWADAGYVGVWHMNWDGSGALVDSAGNNNLALQGSGCSAGDGYVSFGGSCYFQTSSPLGLPTGSQPETIYARVKVNAGSNWNTFVRHGTNSGGQLRSLVYIRNGVCGYSGHIAFDPYESCSNYIAGAVSSTDQWNAYHLSISGGTVKLYQNADLKAFGSRSLNTGNSFLDIGESLTGQVDEVRISNVARSDSYMYAESAAFFYGGEIEEWGESSTLILQREGVKSGEFAARRECPLLLKCFKRSIDAGEGALHHIGFTSGAMESKNAAAYVCWEFFNEEFANADCRGDGLEYSYVSGFFDARTGSTCNRKDFSHNPNGDEYYGDVSLEFFVENVSVVKTLPFSSCTPAVLAEMNGSITFGAVVAPRNENNSFTVKAYTSYEYPIQLIRTKYYSFPRPSLYSSGSDPQTLRRNDSMIFDVEYQGDDASQAVIVQCIVMPQNATAAYPVHFNASVSGCDGSKCSHRFIFSQFPLFVGGVSLSRTGVFSCTATTRFGDTIISRTSNSLAYIIEQTDEEMEAEKTKTEISNAITSTFSGLFDWMLSSFFANPVQFTVVVAMFIITMPLIVVVLRKR